MKIFSFMLLLIGSLNSYAQCTGCQMTITAPTSATFNLTAGQTVCIIGSGSFTGQLNNFNGNTLCIGTGVTYNPSNVNYNGNWTIINNGTFQNTNNLNFNTNTSFTNAATGSVNFSNLNVNGYFSNLGTMTAGSLTVNSGGNVTLGGSTTLSGSIMNNGTITVIGSVTANGITNNSGGKIIGGPNADCNYIRSTGSFTNNGVYGQTGSALLVGNTGGSIQSPASSTVPTAPTAGASNFAVTASGTTINGSYSQTTTGGYVILKAVASSVPATTNPTNFGTLAVGQTLGAWTVLAINSGQTSTTFTDAVPTSCLTTYYRVYTFNATGNCRIFNTTNVLTGSFTPTPTIATTTPASRCGSGSITLNASASSGGTLNWYDANSGGNLVYTGANLTVNLSATKTYYVSASLGSCTSARTSVTATITPNATGTIGNNQELCGNTAANTFSLLGVTGSVVRWESASDEAFTSNVQTISNTNNTLTASQMGTIGEVKYFRAVITNGSCQAYSNVVYVKYPTTTWSESGWNNGAPDSTKKVIFNTNYSSTGDLYACSVQVNSGATVVINTGHNLVVTNEVAINESATPGVLRFENAASLVQSNNTAVNSGKITYKRKTVPVRRMDYTYWASPVAGQNLLAVSPGTLSDKFYQFSPTIGNWQTVAAGSANMTPGRGYIIRAPQSHDLSNPSVYEASFVGVPNNGVISYGVQTGVSKFNLIGNPYASELNIDTFLNDSGNAALLEGTVYLWTHNTLPSSQIPGNWTYNYTSDDYAVYNSTGSVATSGSVSDGISENAPSGKIASGQSFFVVAKANGNVVFRNNMRARGNNRDFFRQSDPDQVQVDKKRIWLNLTNGEGAFKQTLIGYVAGASNGFESKFDGQTFNANTAVNFYSICDNNILAIQGRFPFDAADVVPLGYSATAAGNYTIAIAKNDPAFDSQSVYLKDNLLGTTHDLKASAYDFSTAAGTFDTRFELRFEDGFLASDSFQSANGSVVAWTQNNTIEIAAPKQMQSVEVADVNGRLLLQANINANHFSIDQISDSHQLLLLRIKMDDQSIVIRKILK